MAVAPIINSHFPQIDVDIFNYISNVLTNGQDDFESIDEVFESIGEILLNVSDGKRTEDDVRSICGKFLAALNQ